VSFQELISRHAAKFLTPTCVIPDLIKGRMAECLNNRSVTYLHFGMGFAGEVFE
jgi:hypothetical protein